MRTKKHQNFHQNTPEVSTCGQGYITDENFILFYGKTSKFLVVYNLISIRKPPSGATEGRAFHFNLKLANL